jgi:hypothetical protein
VLVTPHTAFLTSEALTNIAGTTIENLDQVRPARRLLLHVVSHLFAVFELLVWAAVSMRDLGLLCLSQACRQFALGPLKDGTKPFSKI